MKRPDPICGPIYPLRPAGGNMLRICPVWLSWSAGFHQNKMPPANFVVRYYKRLQCTCKYFTVVFHLYKMQLLVNAAA